MRREVGIGTNYLSSIASNFDFNLSFSRWQLLEPSCKDCRRSVDNERSCLQKLKHLNHFNFKEEIITLNLEAVGYFSSTFCNFLILLFVIVQRTTL